MSRGFLRFALTFTSLSFALPAAAHISLDRGGTHKSRYGDADAAIKTGPCGKANGAKGTNIYTYEPGQTITVSFLEFVPHPGYFRFAFDNDGDNDFVTPKSIKPVDPKRACPSNSADQCGKSDFYNSPTVLPNMDNLDPHLAGDPEKYTYQVKLPDVECANCTLQLIQVMEDLVHGPYTPGPGTPGDTFYVSDVYYQCIDIVLKRGTGTGSGGAPGSGGTMTGMGGTMTGMGGTMAGMGGTMTGMGGTMTSMGGMTTNTGGMPAGTGGAVSPGAGGVMASGGVPSGVGGTTAGTTGGAFGTGSVPADPESDEEGGCAVSSASPSSSSGWLAAASSLGLALLLRRTRRAR
jgi:MYXO-CTERM domain-containing protein